MIFIKLFLNFVLVFFLCFQLQAQDVNVPERTAEQEAARQTDRLHQEVNLTPEQEKRVYDINLKYARERVVINSRRESLERSKAKEHELMQVLTSEQNTRLQEKRVERSVYQTVIGTRNASQNTNENTPSDNVRTDRQYQSQGTVRSNFRQNEADASRGTTDNAERSTRYASPSTNRTTTAPARTTSPPVERGSSYSRPSENSTSRSAAPTNRTTTPHSENSSTVPAARQQPSTSTSRSSSTTSSNSNNSRSSSSTENRNSNETRSSSTQRSSSTRK